MNWLAYFALGIVSGWALKSLQVEWRMQALSDFVLQELKDMRDTWKPLEGAQGAGGINLPTAPENGSTAP